MQQVGYVIQHPEVCRTLVIDTADWAEKLCIKAVCDRAHKEGVEDFGYGKGYVYVAEEFGKLINKLDEVISAGVNVVITAHAQMKKIEQPDEMGSYDRWELKLSKQCAPMLKEWADLLLFANYKTIVVSTGKDKYKGQGGQQRIMYTTHTASWDAKNRFSLPEVMLLDYGQIEQLIAQNTGIQGSVQSYERSFADAKDDKGSTENEKRETQEKKEMAQQSEEKTDPLDAFIDDCREKGVTVEVKDREPAKTNIPEYVPRALADLMKEKDMTVSDIQSIVEKRGYFPPGTPFENYPPDFVDGCLIAAFPQLYDFAMQNGLIDLPF